VARGLSGLRRHVAHAGVGSPLTMYQLWEPKPGNWANPVTYVDVQESVINVVTPEECNRLMHSDQNGKVADTYISSL